MNVQRRLTLVVATGAIALGAGHFVQKRAADRMAAAPMIVSAVEPLAAGPEVDLSPTVAPIAISPEPEPVPVIDSPPVLASIPATLPPPVTIPAVAAQPDCAPQLDLIDQPGAMIGLTLLVPCNPNERIVIRHSGLAITGRTTMNGAYFATIPALTPMAEVQIGFASGQDITASIAMPEVSTLHRFGVQWQAADSFQLNAFENGAGYDQPGHISAAFTGMPGDGAFLTILGDSSTDLPLLAEIYTYGADPKADLVLEAAVTQGTCGREILGETLRVIDGTVEITDLTLAMPGCDAIGDILVLKNPGPDLKVAAAN